MEKYTKEVKFLREATSSGKSIINPAMIKTYALDPELAKIYWRIFNFQCCTGYHPKIYLRGLDLIIQRDTESLHPHRLMPVLLFGTEANLHKKYLGRIEMGKAEELNELAP